MEMKNDLDNSEEYVASPPQKRIKVEISVDDDAYLLSTVSAPQHDRRQGPRKKVRRTRSTTEDRALVLLNDSRISAVEPSQVLCRMCGHWIQLFKHIEFAVANWRTHADKCEVRTGWHDRVREEPSAKFTLTIPSLSSLRQQQQQKNPQPQDVNIVTGPSLEAPSSAVIVTEDEMVVTPSAPPTTTESEVSTQTIGAPPPRISGKAETRRISALKADTRIDSFDAHKVLCNMCGSWVRLHNVRTYDLWNWQRHAEKCELRPGHMDPELLQERAAAAAAATSASINHDYSLRQRPPETPIQSPIEQTVSTRRKRRLSEHSHATQTEKGAGLSVRHEAPEYSHGMPSSSGVESVPHIESTGRLTGEEILVKPEPVDHEPETLRVGPSSAHKRRRGRTIEERKQALNDDPRTGEVLPHEVWCLMCKKWIKLYKDVEYIESNWIRHAEKCYLRAVASGDISVRLMKLPKVAGLSYATEFDEASDVVKTMERPPMAPSSPITMTIPITNLSKKEHRPRPSVIKVEGQLGGSASAPPRPRTADVARPKGTTSARVKDETTAEDRRRVLVEDGRCAEIEPQSVLCMVCNRRVGLHAKKDYSLSNWYKHARSCVGAGGHHVQRRPEVPRATFTAPGPAGPSSPRATQTDENADLISQAASRSHMNAGHRRAQLLDDPRVKAVEPNRIQCNICEKWLKLNEIMTYAPYNWYKHIERCVERNNLDDQGIHREIESPKQEVASAPLSAAATRKRYTSQQRLERLQTDSRIKTIEKHRARCGLCNKWVKLQANTEYDPHNWYAHIRKCEVKTDRVIHPDSEDEIVMNQEAIEATSTFDPTIYDTHEGSSARILSRRQLLVADKAALAVEPHRILCGICKQWIKLRDEKPYIPFNWVKHKGKCERRHGLAQSEPLLSPVEPLPSTSGTSVVKEEPVDDTSSLVPSSAGSVASKKSAADSVREATLRADPRQAGVEPGRVLCGLCNQWIRLNLSNGFLPGNWVRHADRCEKKQKLSSSGQLPPTLRRKVHQEQPKQPELSAAEVIDLEAEGLDMNIFGFVELGKIVASFEPSISSTEYARTAKKAEEPAPTKPPSENWSMPTLRARANNNPSISSRMNTPEPASRSASITASGGGDPSRRMHRNEAQRKSDLENDPRTKVVMTDKILCLLCDKWIQMRKDVAYSPQNWLKHAGICEKRHGFVNRTGSSLKIETVPNSDQSDVEEEKPDESELPYSARCRRNETGPEQPAPALRPVVWTSTPSLVEEESGSDSDTDIEESVKPEAQSSTKKSSDRYGKEPQPTALQSQLFDMRPQFAKLQPYRTEYQATQAITPPQLMPYSAVPLYHMVPMGPVQTPPPPSATKNSSSSTSRGAPFVVPMSSQILPHLLPRPMLMPMAQYNQNGSLPSPFLHSATPPVPSAMSNSSSSGRKSNTSTPDLPTPPPTTVAGRATSRQGSLPLPSGASSSVNGHQTALPAAPATLSLSPHITAPQPVQPLKKITFTKNQEVLQLAPPSLVRQSSVSSVSAGTSQGSSMGSSLNAITSADAASPILPPPATPMNIDADTRKESMLIQA